MPIDDKLPALSLDKGTMELILHKELGALAPSDEKSYSPATFVEVLGNAIGLWTRLERMEERLKAAEEALAQHKNRSEPTCWWCHQKYGYHRSDCLYTRWVAVAEEDNKRVNPE